MIPPDVNVLIYAFRTDSADHARWFAALAIESGAEWITTDRDYVRFTGLNWRVPL